MHRLATVGRRGANMRKVVSVLGLVGLLLWSLGSPGMVQATTLEGQRLDIKGADDAGVTTEHYLRVIGVRILGTVVGLAGLGSVPMMGLLAGGSTAAAGVGIAFLPNIVASNADHASAATSLVGMATQAPLSAWLMWSQSIMTTAGLAAFGKVGWSVIRRARRKEA